MKRRIQACFVGVIFLISWAPPPQVALGASLMQYGAWGLLQHPDAFEGKYPAVAYLPPGTVVFETKRAPLPGYVSVFTHFGYWLQIEEEQDGKEILLPLEALVGQIPSDTLLFHGSVLCLGQTDRFAEEGEFCKGDRSQAAKAPVGKGWVYSFREVPNKPGWVSLFAVLDERTKAELTERGWVPAEADFETTWNEIENLERKGLLTALNRPHPQLRFELQREAPILIQCGQEKISERVLASSAGVTATAEAESEVPLWAQFISGLKLKLGLIVEGRAEAGTETTWRITTDTTEQSFLYELYEMIESTGRSYPLIVEKVFECESEGRSPFGQRILKISFEIDEGSDVVVYEFDNPAKLVPVPEELEGFHKRPFFLSVNTPERFNSLVADIVATHPSISANFAHFIAADLNFTCPGRVRTGCSELVATATNE